MKPANHPVPTDKLAIFLDDQGIRNVLELHGLWPKFLASREVSIRKRNGPGAFGWCLFVPDTDGSISAFVGLEGYVSPVDNGYVWYYLADGKSEVAMNELAGILAELFPGQEFRNMGTGEVGSLN